MYAIPRAIVTCVLMNLSKNPDNGEKRRCAGSKLEIRIVNPPSQWNSKAAACRGRSYVPMYSTRDDAYNYCKYIHTYVHTSVHVLACGFVLYLLGVYPTST